MYMYMYMYMYMWPHPCMCFTILEGEEMSRQEMWGGDVLHGTCIRHHHCLKVSNVRDCGVAKAWTHALTILSLSLSLSLSLYSHKTIGTFLYMS